MRGVGLVLAWLFAVLLLGTAALPLILPFLPSAAALQVGWHTLTSLGWGVAATAVALAFLFGATYSRVGGFWAALGRVAWLLAAVQWLWALGNLPAGLLQFGLGLGVAALGAWWGRPTAGRVRRKQIQEVELADRAATEMVVLDVPEDVSEYVSEDIPPEPLRLATALHPTQVEGSQSAAPHWQMAQGQDWAEQVWWDEDEVPEQTRNAASD